MFKNLSALHGYINCRACIPLWEQTGKKSPGWITGKIKSRFEPIERHMSHGMLKEKSEGLRGLWRNG